MNKWIPVSEKPQIHKQVLIFEPSCDGNPENDIYAVTCYMGEKPRGRDGRYFYEWPDGQDEQPSGYCPTHWQLLPEPPKK